MFSDLRSSNRNMPTKSNLDMDNINAIVGGSLGRCHHPHQHGMIQVDKSDVFKFNLY